MGILGNRRRTLPAGRHCGNSEASESPKSSPRRSPRSSPRDTTRSSSRPCLVSTEEALMEWGGQLREASQEGRLPLELYHTSRRRGQGEADKYESRQKYVSRSMSLDQKWASELRNLE